MGEIDHLYFAWSGEHSKPGVGDDMDAKSFEYGLLVCNQNTDSIEEFGTQKAVRYKYDWKSGPRPIRGQVEIVTDPAPASGEFWVGRYTIDPIPTDQPIMSVIWEGTAKS